MEDLISACEQWDETALDQYQVPHPVIGNLTVREMLFFTIHHNLRHASQEGIKSALSDNLCYLDIRRGVIIRNIPTPEADPFWNTKLNGESYA